jgi:AraC family transcriptional regulator, regulatory protein of adaptative response / methylated-DNA-[protein]-cysteine methyltransferase
MTTMMNTIDLNDERRWQAVLARDGRWDGLFVYAVRSTGIFCRPSCPSRRPKRARVTFFDGAEAAVQAGYRPCQRCRPEHPACSDPRLVLVRRVCALIMACEDTMPSLAQLSAETGCSAGHLQRQFKAVTGISPKQYAGVVKLERAKALLRQGEPVASALYGAGYGSSSRLYEQASARLGMTPASYGKGGRGARIVYTIVPSPILPSPIVRGPVVDGPIAPGAGPDRLLVAATKRGLCLVAMGDGKADLEQELRAEYPAAEIVRDDAALADWASAVVALADGAAPRGDLPSDVRATALQRLVWDRLQQIPSGVTRTYGSLAADIGHPNAVRAVGRACAANPLALVVPCHRVVGAGGALCGYRWGVERKEALLARERERASLARQRPGT